VRKYNKIDYHKFVDEELYKKGFCIKHITQEYMNLRLKEIMEFVNGILTEYKDIYKLWSPKPKDWFLKPMNRKWKFSFIIEKNSGDIGLFNFSSVYGNNLHNHCTYVNRIFRGIGLAKLHMIKLCQTGLDDGFKKYEGYWDKGNNRSIILHLKMGFKIETMRKNEQLLLIGNLREIRDQTYKLYLRKSLS